MSCMCFHYGMRWGWYHTGVSLTPAWCRPCKISAHSHATDTPLPPLQSKAWRVVQGVKNEGGEVGLEEVCAPYAVKRHTAPETVTQLITGCPQAGGGSF
jgi:hypothetical protein